MLVIFKQVAVLFLFCLMGFILAKKKVADPEKGGLLSALAVYVFLPCTAFNTFSANFTPAYLREKYPLVLVATVILVLLILNAKVLTRKIQGYDRAVFEYSLIVPNASYVGLPLVQALYSQEAALDMLMFGLTLTMYTYTLGYDLLTQRSGGKFSPKRLLTPVTVAMLLGCIVGLTGFQTPDVITQVTGGASACLGPTGMLLLGMTVSQFRVKDLVMKWQIYPIIALRLVVLPTVIFGICKLLQADYALLPAICTYAMPCGLNSIVFPKLVGQDCTRGAGLVLVSTVLSLVTIPICLYIFL